MRYNTVRQYTEYLTDRKIWGDSPINIWSPNPFHARPFNEKDKTEYSRSIYAIETVSEDEMVIIRVMYG